MPEQDPVATGSTAQTAYGRVFRERGTLRIVIVVAVLFVAWYAYTSVRTATLNAKKWPELTASQTGLTVLGLRDKDRPGWRHKYEAREANHAWQIRRPDESEPGDYEDVSKEDKPKNAMVSDPNDPEAKDRPTQSSVERRASSGAIVPIEEVMSNCPVVLLGSHVTGVTVERAYDSFRGVDYYKVHLGLTPEGSSRYWQFSREHEDERLAFVLQGELFTCAQIKHMDVSSFTIEPIWVKADAERFASFMNGKR